MIRTCLFALLIAIASCKEAPKKEKTKIEEKFLLMEVDKDFSRLSEQKGMKAAFLEYIDSNGVLLRANNFPMLGADAVDYLIAQNDSTYILQWEPRNGEVAQSGELGYTYGIYALRPTATDTVLYGTYVSIWKKQKNGKWKFVLDTGNEGLGEIQPEEEEQ